MHDIESKPIGTEEYQRSVLLVPIAKWVSRQQENFTSEIFAAVIRRILQKNPSKVLGLISKLFKLEQESIKGTFEDLEVRTQLAAKDHGILDVAIISTDACLLVESKTGAAEGFKQLDRYVEFLALQKNRIRSILYLTHPFVLVRDRPPVAAPGVRFSHIRWSDALRILRATSSQCSDSVLDFMLDEFKDLLCHWGLVMNTHIPNSIMEGVKSIPQFTHMLSEALHKCEAIKSVSKSKSHDYIGWNLKIKGESNNDSWVGFYFDQPERIWAFVRIGIVEKMRRTPREGIIFETGSPWKPETTYPALDLKKAGFFDRSDPNDQATIIGEFLGLIAQAASASP